MTLFERASAYVLRRKKESIIYFLLVLTLTTIITCSYSIRSAIKIIEQNMLSSAKVIVTIQENKEAVSFEINENDVKSLGTSEYVEDFDFNYYYNIYFPKVTHSFSEDFEDEINKFVVQDKEHGEEFKITGVDNDQLFDVIVGKGELSSGRMFTEQEIIQGEHALIISEKLAETNNLNLGDIIQGDQLIFDSSKERKITDIINCDFKIIGLYAPIVEPASETITSDLDKHQQIELDNTMFAPNNALKNAYKLPKEDENTENTENTENAGMMNNIFLLRSATDLESFQNMVEQLYASKAVVVVMQNEFEPISQSFDFMIDLTEKIFYVGLIASILIISIMCYLFTKKRTIEFGIYRALGEKNWRILLQVLIEVTLISSIAIVISTILGVASSKMIVSLILKNQLLATYQLNNQQLQETMLTQLSNFSGNTLSIRDVIKFILINFAVLFIGTTIPMCYILQSNPKKNLIGG